MSRKRRNKRPSARPAAPARTAGPGARRGFPAGESLRKALDGYANAAAFLGESSPLMSAGTFLRRGLTRNTELLTAAYRESWLAKRIIDMPAEDMTRKWYSLSTAMEDEDLKDLKRLEARHSVRQEITNAIRWARLYGGSLAVMVVRDGQEDLAAPLDPASLVPGCFQGLLVLDRSRGISPSLELVTDLDDPDFGEPAFYEASLADGDGSVLPVRIHHSRVLKFTGRELPRTEAEAESYWGASELEHIWDELQKRSATSANIAQLVFQANITTMKISDFGDALAMGTDREKADILSAMSEENRFRTSYGFQLMGKEDQLETHPYSFSGLGDIYESFMMDMAGAAEIPATKLFGRSPQGFNANGLSDLKNYAEMISGLQERMLRPALERLLPVMAVSCWDFCPEDLEIVFEPIIAPTPEERASLMEKLSGPVIEAYKTGLLSRAEAAEELKARGEPYGFWSKIQV